MSRGNSTVDYSTIQQCESRVDASFRKLRLGRMKFKKNQSDAKESYLRKILDVHRKAEAIERKNAYNKRIHLKQRLRQPLSSSSSQKEELDSQTKLLHQPIDEHPEENNQSASSSPDSPKSPQSAAESDWDSSPYKRAAPLPSSQNRNFALKKHLCRGDTHKVLNVDEDIQKDYEEGRISKGQYHKLLLFRNKMIYCMCLEELDEKCAAGKDYEAVQRDREEVEKELQKVIARNPKAHASLHPRAKVVTSHAYSIAFRPHREEPSKRNFTARPPSRLERSPEKQQKSVSVPRTERQQFAVSTRPGTAGVSLGGGTSLRIANPKHGGRLSSQNLVNYLLNRSVVTSRSFHCPQPPVVRSAVQRARARVVAERSRSLPRGETLRLKSLSQLVRSRQSQAGSYIEVGLDIPSRLPSPTDSEARSSAGVS